MLRRMLTPTIGHCRDVLVFARRHLVEAKKNGQEHEQAWAELVAIRKVLAGQARETPVNRKLWHRVRAVGNATGLQSPKVWWNCRRWGGRNPD